MKINPWLADAVELAEKRRIDPQLDVIIEVDPKLQSQVAAALKRIGVNIISTLPGFIRARVPSIAVLEEIEKIEGVRKISYNVPIWPLALGIDELFKRVAVLRDTLLSKLSSDDLGRLGIKFKPAAILPTIPEFIVTKIAQLITPFAPAASLRNIERQLVTETRKIIEAPSDNRIRETKVAVIDTGANPHPAFRKLVNTLSLVPEPPPDAMGHGMWCSTCAFGDPVPTRYGFFVPVASAPGKLFMHVKVFTAFGPTSAWHIMAAMFRAADWGAKVVNMSLGGPLQGRVDDDPECVLLKQLSETYGTIFVVAAGNEGPEEWTISSPGASPHAITVAAIDWKTHDTSSYSSRGPQGSFYRDNPDVFEEDLRKYGDLLLKPDIAAPGGDTKTQIVSGVTGWYDSIYDLIPDGFEPMIGTSMATPHAAGLIALLVDRGAVKSAVEIKRVMSKLGEKTVDKGWGTIKWSLFE